MSLAQQGGMTIKTQRVGSRNFITHSPDNADWPDTDAVLSSWKDGSFKLPESKSETHVGFRSTQVGAICAIKAHWTVSSAAATVVMPTGTGKTEVMIALVVSECLKKTCVIVPSNLLRKQTVEKFSTLGKLREIGAIDESFKNPVVACLIASPKSIGELQELLDSSNLIVTTMSLLNSGHFKKEHLELLAATCDTLIIDEAHHVPAGSWQKIKSAFSGAKCLQFTATPFRRDGKKIDGDIIYNFPIALAQEQGYFKPINFYPIYEFDNDKKDFSVAAKAVELLEADIARGYPHLLLVRASKKNRAIALFENVYKKKYARYSPVLIISGNSKSANRAALENVNSGISKIIVCVDMFSEGIDMPSLKICAIHDKYKSLPITMQFIGRFARAQAGLGEASVVANIADDDIQETLEDLYTQDANWNKVLKNVSEEKIANEVRFQELARGFTGKEVIPLSQLRPKISMYMYTTTETRWHWHRWSKVFDEECSNHIINHSERILIVTERQRTKVDWTTCRDITDDNWNLHILYWNTEKNVFFINTTDKRRAYHLAEAVFDSFTMIKGEEVFRCLSGIKRLMLAAVGLKTAISSHYIRYRMFAGMDVGEGIASSTASGAIKSNLFGVGFENGDSVSIGCSYKGTIWAKWVATVDYWKDWCDRQASKVLDSSIDTTIVLKNALIPEEIEARPKIVPYRIDLPREIGLDTQGNIQLRAASRSTQLFLVDIQLTVFDETSPLSFYVGNEEFKEEFTLLIDEKGYTVIHKAGLHIQVSRPRKEDVSLVEYFCENPPVIWFVDGSSLEGNYFLPLKGTQLAIFDVSKITPWNWSGINIRKESQGVNRESDSIQYRLIADLKNRNQYRIIFDDDGSGEVADVVALREDDVEEKIIFELYHCKFSNGDQPGARVSDLYEVCGQAEKCAIWTEDAKALVDRLIKRETDRIGKGHQTRFEIGDKKSLFILKNKLRFHSVEYRIFIVQPGVDSKRILPQMHQILCSTETFLMETSGIELGLICS